MCSFVYLTDRCFSFCPTLALLVDTPRSPCDAERALSSYFRPLHSAKILVARCLTGSVFLTRSDTPYHSTVRQCKDWFMLIFISSRSLHSGQSGTLHHQTPSRLPFYENSCCSVQQYQPVSETIHVCFTLRVNIAVVARVDRSPTIHVYTYCCNTPLLV